MPSLITIVVLPTYEFVVTVVAISMHNMYSTNNICLLTIVIGHHVNGRMVGKHGIGLIGPCLSKLKKIGA